MANNFTIKLTYILYADPEKVFEALTQSPAIKKWSGGAGKVDAKPEGDFELFDGWVKGKVLDYSPGKSLSYSWKVAEWDKRTKPSNVKYSFKKHKAGTEVFLEHTDLPSLDEKEKHESGWIDYVFEPLNDYFTS